MEALRRLIRAPEPYFLADPDNMTMAKNVLSKLVKVESSLRKGRAAAGAHPARQIASMFSYTMQMHGHQ